MFKPGSLEDLGETHEPLNTDRRSQRGRWGAKLGTCSRHLHLDHSPRGYTSTRHARPVVASRLICTSKRLQKSRIRYALHALVSSRATLHVHFLSWPGRFSPQANCWPCRYRQTTAYQRSDSQLAVAFTRLKRGKRATVSFSAVPKFCLEDEDGGAHTSHRLTKIARGPRIASA